MTFRLDARLGADTMPVTDLALCDLRLMNDARYGWLVLVPRRPDAVEVHDLPAGDRLTLMEEIAAAARALVAVDPGCKINIGALGNIVRQLHIHVVARREGDAAWPGPVWGQGKAVPYGAAARDDLIGRLRTMLGAGSND